ncbi:MAG TPA: hypothetical protein PLX89_22525 [Verrucomicrobiota bacterium]|nr:hypothetical protein [Verrucomicrobiales bacterium]HRI15782.1 hypothetical protein [Verrucomicrobiota bacterium]
MDRFAASAPSGELLQKLEPFLRTAIFKPATAIVGFLLQQSVDAFDAAYRPPSPVHFRKKFVLHPKKAAQVALKISIVSA